MPLAVEACARRSIRGFIAGDHQNDSKHGISTIPSLRHRAWWGASQQADLDLYSVPPVKLPGRTGPGGRIWKPEGSPSSLTGGQTRLQRFQAMGYPITTSADCSMKKAARPIGQSVICSISVHLVDDVLGRADEREKKKTSVHALQGPARANARYGTSLLDSKSFSYTGRYSD